MFVIFDSNKLVFKRIHKIITLMTKTIFGKKLLMIATITVLVTGLTLAATLDDAEAKKAKTGEHKLKCKSVGSFFTPTAAGVFSSSVGKCSAGLGQVTSAAISLVTPSTPGCVTLTSAGDDFSVGKNGFIMFTTTGEQCFNDASGAPLGAAWDGFFCAGTDSAYTSEVIGTYAISGGLVKNSPVSGGSGDFVSLADHCASGTAPYGNSFTTTLEGTIIFS